MALLAAERSAIVREDLKFARIASVSKSDGSAVAAGDRVLITDKGGVSDRGGALAFWEAGVAGSG
ncbi:hypothetical protein LUW76_47620 [Actinomadura madurae]|uniref:hypothetical protein n=1 Tax=Actinomadura madurae TaxID=1993 RepID=UPI0020260450|nr:hypothetical protein [Actinomadura madurae]URN01356.1 hypothetical protein LUW76_47620 [Actinomadura madurae]URN03468.1 hypothetical protein LUW74_09030 [Actinomadura madurae]